MSEGAKGIDEDGIKRKMEKIDFYAEEIYNKLNGIDTVMSAMRNGYKGNNADKLYAKYKMTSENYIKVYNKIKSYNDKLELVIMNYQQEDINIADSI